jgi:hypothetical protein
MHVDHLTPYHRLFMELRDGVVFGRGTVVDITSS